MGALTLAAPAVAQERRFPDEHITAEEWNTYLAEVKALPNVTIKEDDQQTTITREEPTLTIYSFTKPANPAHPGVVVRKLLSRQDGYFIHRAGYYAGSRDEFARWWQRFDALDQKLKADIAAGSQSPAAAPIQVRKGKIGTFILTISSDRFADLNEAQMALRPKAIEVCQGRRPTLGVYRLDRTVKVGAPASAPATLKLDQEIICE
jgi:hypothetical protein